MRIHRNLVDQEMKKKKKGKDTRSTRKQRVEHGMRRGEDWKESYGKVIVQKRDVIDRK